MTDRKEKASYSPKPVDLSGVELPQELAPLVEAMARNVHEVWAEGRLSQGWKWGPERSDEQKTHPCLVDYDELTEVERDYDRHTALSTLKLIVKLGFKISRD